MTALRHEVAAGEDPAIVFLHEGAGSGQLWAGLRDVLRGGRRALLYDRRGFGGSPRNASFGADHFEQAVDDLVQLLHEVGSGPVDLVGHSDGGSVALLAAIRHPSTVRSVCAVATHVYADPHTVAALRSLGSVHEWDDRTRAHYERQHGDDWAQVVTSWLAMWTSGALETWDLRDELSAIQCPVLVVHDRDDPLSPTEHADAILGSVAGGQVSWHNSGTHRPHLSDRERFASDLQTFWTSVATPR